MSNDHQSVVMYDCAVSEVGSESIVRGVVDVGSLSSLQTAPYQREALPVSSVEDWTKAFGCGGVPDIDLGMRGYDFSLLGSGRIRLNDQVFIVDGLQRVTAARELVEGGLAPYLGATVRFGTTEQTERERFQRLNVQRTKLSTNVVAANTRHEIPVVEALYRLTTESSSFVLAGRVTWGQRARQGDLVSAISLLKVAGELHAHLGSTRYSEMVRLAPALQEVAEAVTLERLVANVVYLFDFVDQSWKLGQIQYRERSVPNRLAFLTGLARMFSDHLDFWQNDTLFVRQPDKRKLAKYPVADPSVQAMVSGGSGRQGLYRDLVGHMNSGRRHGHLRLRGASA